MINTVTLSKIFDDVKMSSLSRGDKFFLNKKEFVFHKVKRRRLPKIGRTTIIVCYECNEAQKERWFTRDWIVTVYKKIK